MSDSFVPIIRKKLDEILSSKELTPNAKLLFIHYLCKANFKTGYAKRGDVVNRGSIVTSVATTLKEVDMTEKTYYKVLQILLDKGYVKKFTNAKGTVISVQKYNDYVDQNVPEYTSKKSGTNPVINREDIPTFSRTNNNVLPEFPGNGQPEPSRSFESRDSGNNVVGDLSEHPSGVTSITQNTSVELLKEQIRISKDHMDYLNQVYGSYYLVENEILKLNKIRLKSKKKIDDPESWLEKCLENKKLEIISKTLRGGLDANEG